MMSPLERWGPGRATNNAALEEKGPGKGTFGGDKGSLPRHKKDPPGKEALDPGRPDGGVLGHRPQVVLDRFGDNPAVRT